MEAKFEAWKKQSTPENLEALLQASSPTLDSAITSYAGGDKSLRGHAKLLAIDAFNTFDPSKKVKLQTHLMNQLQPLRRVSQAYRQPLHIPERVEQTGNKLFGTMQELEASLGREPSDQELADHVGMSVKKIRHIRRYMMPVAAESAFSGGDDDSESDSMPGVSRPDPQKIWMDYVYHDLSPIDKKILEWKTGAYGHPVLPTQEVAKRLGVTAGAVSQRAAKISAKLSEGAGVDV